MLRYEKSLIKPATSILRVTAIAWSPNGKRLAVVTTDKVVFLFDDKGERQDKFKAKANADVTQPDFVVRAMCYSPDSTRLAIAQSDNIVFVYKLGLDWGEKKSISNKLTMPAAITTLVWRPSNETEMVFGLANGSVKLGVTAKNKAYNLYQHPDDAQVVSMSCSPNGAAVYVGHVDASIYKFTFVGSDDPSEVSGFTKLCAHTCVPTALGCNRETVLAAGVDLKIAIYSKTGRLLQTHNLASDPTLRDFTCIAVGPSLDVAVVGAFDAFVGLSFSEGDTRWNHTYTKKVPNMYAVSAMAWDPSGAKLVLGTLTGGVDVYAASLRRALYAPGSQDGRPRAQFELQYTSKRQIQITKLANGSRLPSTKLSSTRGHEITKVDIYRDQFVVAFTTDTLLLGNLATLKLSEIPWQQCGSEKFHFDNDRVVMVYTPQGELTVVEYENNTPLMTLRTEHMSPYLVSCVVNDARTTAHAATPPSQKLAYLIDVQTIKLLDIANGTSQQISHDHSIDWVELNQKGSHLLFRDRRRHLHLFNALTGERVLLLNYVGYVQWVPDSDVIVAQSRDNLCVWYSIHKTEHPFIFTIKGEVQGIEKTPEGTTEVLVQEEPGSGEDGIVGYQLDDNLVYFGAAMEEQWYEKAMEVLEPLERTPDTEAQWQQLASSALEAARTASRDRVGALLAIAERCYAAIGDVARSRYLHKLAKKHRAGDAQAIRAEAQLDMLFQRWANAEQTLVSRGLVDDAIASYLSCHKWEDAIRVAQANHHVDAGLYKSQYLQHLINTRQQEEAGRLKESEGDYQQAITYYVDGGVPAQAARCIIAQGAQLVLSNDVTESILAKLKNAKLFETAGELYEHLQRFPEALDAYRKANNYSKAVSLATSRANLGAEVVPLHEAWGDHLVSRQQFDNAINHYVEAGANTKAARVALDAGNLGRAAALIAALRPQEQEELSSRLAKLYELAGNLADAEKHYIRAGKATAAIHMYFDANRWDDAHKVAVGYLEDQSQMDRLYQQRARTFRAAKQYKNAEKTLLAIGQWKAAAEMYKEAGHFVDYLRMIQKHDAANVKSAQAWVAAEREKEGLYREAEKIYCEAGEWKSAVRMYRKINQWEDTLRVAKVFGGVNASKQVAYAWAVNLENEQGSAAKLAMLKKMGLIEYAIEYAIESGDFEHAFQLAQQSGNAAKLPDIHLKHAMFLEDEGQFAEAERAFLQAGKPKEAIEMYMHQQMWPNALAIAEAHDAGSVALVYRTHGSVLANEGKIAEAEKVFLQGKAPDPAIKMYRDREMWEDAARIARHYRPEVLQELEKQRATHIQQSQGAQGVEGKLQRAVLFERQGAINSALDTYMSITAADTKDVGKLEAAWAAAARLAAQTQRSSEVAAEGARRLMQIGRPEAAAQLHLNISDRRGAVGVFCQAGLRERARQVAEGDPLLLQVVEQFERGAGGGAQLASAHSGDSAMAAGAASQDELEELARRGNWGQVHERARMTSTVIAAHFVVSHAKKLASQGLFNEAAVMLAEQGAPAEASHLQLYCHIALGVLAAKAAARDQAAESSLKDVLFGLYNKLKDVPGMDAEALSSLQQCQMAAHYLVMYNQAQQNGWWEMAAKSATSLLRYIAPIRVGQTTASVVPADKAFYLAGMAWKRVPEKRGQAFVFLNALLDISEAIEDGSMAALDLSDLVDSGIPLTFVLPQRDAAYIEDHAVEEAKDWVLEVSMQQDVDQNLAIRSCANCGRDIYEGALKCDKCGNVSEACAVTGYPIPAGEKVESKGAFRVRAARDDFNTYVAKYGVCPVTGSTQTAIA